MEKLYSIILILTLSNSYGQMPEVITSEWEIISYYQDSKRNPSLVEQYSFRTITEGNRKVLEIALSRKESKSYSYCSGSKVLLQFGDSVVTLPRVSPIDCVTSKPYKEFVIIGQYSCDVPSDTLSKIRLYFTDFYVEREFNTDYFAR